MQTLQRHTQRLSLIRQYSTKKSKGNRYSPQPPPNLPEFQTLLREFYKKSHPDILKSISPEAAEINSKSFQVLNGILSTCKQMNEYPPRTIQTIPFCIRQSNGTIQNLDLNIRTSGGDCKKALTVEFERFFSTSGILVGKFKWNSEYFPVESFDPKAVSTPPSQSSESE